MFDTRPAAAKIGMPASLAGQRCLDVGTSDGFWAFEMEKRGAAEVVAIDLGNDAQADVTVGGAPLLTGATSRQSQTFALARRLLGSKVDWMDLSVYDASPERLGRFDFVFASSLLMHLQDPVRALTAMHSVCNGEMMSFEPISPILSLLHPRLPAARFIGVTRTDWWVPNIAAHRQWVEAGGFRIVQSGKVSFIKRRGLGMRAAVRHPVRAGLLATLGIPQHWVVAQPR